MFAGRAGTGFSEKFLANIDAQLQKLRACHLSLHQLNGEITRQMVSRDYIGGHETLHWGQTCPGRPSQIHRVDARRQPVFRGLRTDKEAKDVVRK
jgi:hypothetical protein